MNAEESTLIHEYIALGYALKTLRRDAQLFESDASPHKFNDMWLALAQSAVRDAGKRMATLKYEVRKRGIKVERLAQTKDVIVPYEIWVRGKETKIQFYSVALSRNVRAEIAKYLVASAD
ncbi:hypothetical protein JCM19037_1594 [Geomicrobium sp. JCM 19037]|uniref:hypothetical protein n=1 Tax=Geomicrobium sp. JCM 19037 TaxID=1460634 RepID=UPI00045F3AF6|nr:hypothetical protein [Geomicrobium sp. JCM 19037]GAK03282.1 hypothetical protein JCM19037_1594 [Geomicrobium sp. JCM 19037]